MHDKNMHEMIAAAPTSARYFVRLFIYSASEQAVLSLRFALLPLSEFKQHYTNGPFQSSSPL